MMRKIKTRGISLLLALLLMMGLYVPAGAISESDLTSAVNKSAKNMLNAVKTPQVGSIGGEWAVIGLARSGYDVPQSYWDDYYATVEDYVKSCSGVLHKKKYTEYSRAIIAVTAMDRDPKAVAGYDLLLPLANYEQVCWQGNNGPIWALIALDCGKWEIPEDPSVAVQASRQMYLEKILSAQQESGGWGLADKQPADVDITAMALQALAGYADQQAVSAAIERGLAWLAAQERHTCESVAQVLVALGELGIALEDERFAGLTDELLGFYREGQGFVHEQADSESNYMSTEQAFYAICVNSWKLEP